MLEEAVISDDDEHFGGTIVGESLITEQMMNTFSLGRMIKILSLIDLIFACVFAFGNAFFFIPIFMPIIGYLGATYYNKNMTLGYFIYIFGITTFRLIYYLHIYINLSVEERQNQVQTISVVLISTFIELWISKIIYNFYRALTNLPLLDITTLRLNTNLTNPRLILW
jgi:hypothetical protein